MPRRAHILDPQMASHRQAEIFAACDRLQASGRQPSVRSVRDLLSGGGSLRDITPVVREWKSQRDEKTAAVAVALAARLDAFEAGKFLPKDDHERKLQALVARVDILLVENATANARLAAFEAGDLLPREDLDRQLAAMREEVDGLRQHLLLQTDAVRESASAIEQTLRRRVERLESEKFLLEAKLSRATQTQG